MRSLILDFLEFSGCPINLGHRLDFSLCPLNISVWDSVPHALPLPRRLIMSDKLPSILYMDAQQPLLGGFGEPTDSSLGMPNGISVHFRAASWLSVSFPYEGDLLALWVHFRTLHCDDSVYVRVARG